MSGFDCLHMPDTLTLPKLIKPHVYLECKLYCLQSCMYAFYLYKLSAFEVIFTKAGDQSLPWIKLDQSNQSHECLINKVSELVFVNPLHLPLVKISRIILQDTTHRMCV